MILFLDENILRAITNKPDRILTELLKYYFGKKGLTVETPVKPCKTDPSLPYKEVEFSAPLHGKALAEAVYEKAKICRNEEIDEKAEKCVKKGILNIKAPQTMDNKDSFGKCKLPRFGVRDEDIVHWCTENDAILVTQDKGYMLPPPAKLLVNLSCNHITKYDEKILCVVDQITKKYQQFCSIQPQICAKSPDTTPEQAPSPPQKSTP